MKKLRIALSSLLVCLLLASCTMSPGIKSGSSADTNTNASSSSSADKIVIGLPVYTMEHPYYIEFVDTAKRKAAELGVELLVTDAALDPVKQVAITENMMTQGINALIITAIDPKGIISTLDDAAGKGVKVIVEGTPLEKNGAPYGLTFVGVNNYDAAYKGGEWAGKYVNDSLAGVGRVAILSFPIDPACQNREKGFIEGLQAVCPAAEIVASQNGDAVRDKSMSVMENILTANPDINVVYGINDDSALGALAAMEARSMGQANELVVTFDGTKDGRDAIRSGGMLQCAIYQSPSEIAEACINACIAAVKGEVLPPTVDIATQLITKDNVDEFDD